MHILYIYKLDNLINLIIATQNLKFNRKLMNNVDYIFSPLYFESLI